MRASLFGFSIFLLRTGDAARLAEWYAGVLGLPIVRGREPIFYVSLGDVYILELLADKGDPGKAPQGLELVIGSVDLAVTTSRLAARRAVMTADGDESVRTHDPDGNSILIRQAKGQPKRLMAACCSPLAADLAGLCALKRRCADPHAMTRYYARLLGAEVLPSPAVSLGGGVSLEVCAGGQATEAPRTRSGARHCFILRSADHDRALAEISEHNPTPVETGLDFNSASLSYFADPEGQLWGIDERYRPQRFKTQRRPFPEDTEILRRIDMREAP